MITNTTNSPHARFTSLDAGDAAWDAGLLAGRVDAGRTTTVPTMRALMDDPAATHAIENFRVAAGLTDGVHLGPPFMDGDFYKWLEAAVVASGPTPDADLDALIDLVRAAQRSDGYLHTPALIAERATGVAGELADRLNFETYNLGHLMTAACLHHRLTGDDRLLDAARRAADFLVDLLKRNPDAVARGAICPSHYMGLVELHRETADPAYLDLARRLLDVRDTFVGGDDNQDRVPLRDHQVIAGHAVRANYLYAGVADVALETGDPELMAVLDRVWGDLVDTKLYVTGGCGALYDGASPDGWPDQSQITRVHQAYGRAYQLPNVTAHNETCAQIGLVLWAWRMLALTADGRYADAIETVLLNGFLAGVGLDARTYFYTNPLRQAPGLPAPLRRPGDTALDPVPDPPPSTQRLREAYLSCFCCPPNVARLLVELPYLAASRDRDGDGLWVHQYASGRLRAGGFAVTLATDYPWEGAVAVAVTDAPAVSAGLRLRIPAWAGDAWSLRLNGDPVRPTVENGYLTLDRSWAAGDRVDLGFPLHARLLEAHPLAEEVANHVAVVRGPVVYCAESVDNPPTLTGLLVPESARFAEEKVTIGGVTMLTLRTDALRRDAASADTLYRDLDRRPRTRVPLTLIPYFAWANRGPTEMTVWLPIAWEA